MTDAFMAEYAERHHLGRLLGADPGGFAAAMSQTANAGAAMERPDDKESGPAPVFRPTRAAQ